MTILYQLQVAHLFLHFHVSVLGICLTKNGILQFKWAALWLFPSGIHNTEKEIMVHSRIDGL